MKSMREFMELHFKNLDERLEHAVKHYNFYDAIRTEAQKTEASHLYMEMLRRNLL